MLCDKQEAEASTSKLWSEQVDEGASEHRDARPKPRTAVC